jgi:hypothetical protein
LHYYLGLVEKKNVWILKEADFTNFNNVDCVNVRINFYEGSQLTQSRQLTMQIDCRKGVIRIGTIQCMNP